MPAFLILIAGIILMFNPGWFAGAATVGLICTIFGGALLALWLVMTVFVGAKVNKEFRRF